MENLEDVKKMMSHEDVLKRFKKVFGREMTHSERNGFFLSPEEAPHKEEKGSGGANR
jgi:hypothetical protein